MSALTAKRDPLISLQQACTALGMSRATLDRQGKTKGAQCCGPVRPSPPRLSEGERQVVLDVLHEPRLPDQVYAQLVAEGHHLCSIPTTHRMLAQLR